MIWRVINRRRNLNLYKGKFEYIKRFFILLIIIEMKIKIVRNGYKNVNM